MSDLFVSLGYEGVRLEIARSGREIDLEATHRIEERRAIAECKATDKPASGSDLNKFAGAVDVERKKNDISTQAYFVSLSGFTETARDQEADAGARMVLLTGNDVLDNLIKGKIIVDFATAAQRAGASTTDRTLMLDARSELLGHRHGWIWGVYFSRGGKLVAFALVHADGGFLAPSLAEEVIEDDRTCGGLLADLIFLEPPPPTVLPDSSRLAQVRARYLAHLESEYGSIQIEGLPTDQELGTRRLKLEEIYTPLHLDPLLLDPPNLDTAQVDPLAFESFESSRGDPTLDEALQDVAAEITDAPTRLPLGSVLQEHSRLVILAPPGGGKTTLLKRLTTAYASPERSARVHDQLPIRRWLPLVIRCRQLEEHVRRPLRDILNLIPSRAELPEDREDFSVILSEALRRGDALILIDGLDEIAAESDRVAFVAQLRTFLATYPNVAMVVTSREAGFRIVGKALVDICAHYSLSTFDDEDIKTLTCAWYAHVVGNTKAIRREAEKLAEQIATIDRLRRLAENPLLLTTLLLVRRCVGELPRKRSLLYQRAIDVLLMTWNVEGHQPIDAEEAIPQLAYIAYVMLSEEMRTISRKRLQELIIAARADLAEELAYTQMTPSEFITRIEDRSSVLSLTGWTEEDGRSEPHYEFKHLTFQEYLTAVSIVDGYYPDRSSSRAKKVEALVRPQLLKETWREVIPLVAVLSGRNGGSVVRLLLDRIEKMDRRTASPRTYIELERAMVLLGRCLSDEVKMTPALAQEASLTLARWRAGREGQAIAVLESKYGQTYRHTVEAAFFESPEAGRLYGSALATIASHDLVRPATSLKEAVSSILTELGQDDERRAVKAALAAMALAYGPALRTSQTEDANEFARLARDLCEVTITDNNPYVQYAAIWALVWIVYAHRADIRWKPSLYKHLFELWLTSPHSTVRRQAAWLFADLPLLDRGSKPLGSITPGIATFLQNEYESDGPDQDFHRRAAVAAAYYFGGPWDDKELQARTADLQILGDDHLTVHLEKELARHASVNNTDDEQSG